jgi:hypothetical protein
MFCTSPLLRARQRAATPPDPRPRRYFRQTLPNPGSDSVGQRFDRRRIDIREAAFITFGGAKDKRGPLVSSDSSVA